ncbi:serine/threonine-protein kinase KIN2, partial [Physocladia obscura]
LPFRDSNVKELYKKITSASFELPVCIGKESGSLICSMLKADPLERAKIDDIKSHIWVNVGYESPPDSFVPPRPQPVEPLSKITINTMRLYGFDEDLAKKAILSSTTSPAFLLYCLIKEHDAAELKSSKVKPAIENLTATKSTLEVPSRNASVRRRKSIAAIGTHSQNANIRVVTTDTSTFVDTKETTSLFVPQTSSSGLTASSLNPHKSNLKSRKSISGAPPSASILKKEGNILVPKLSINSQETDTNSGETSPLPSVTQLNLPVVKERHRSLSFRKHEKKLPLSQAEEIKPITTVYTLGSHSEFDPSLKKQQQPNTLSIADKITNALTKIINRPRSRRGSFSPEGSFNMISAVPRVSKNIYGVDTTSSKKPENIVKELNRVFELNGVASNWTAFKVQCAAPGLVFDIEL